VAIHIKRVRLQAAFAQGVAERPVEQPQQGCAYVSAKAYHVSDCAGVCLRYGLSFVAPSGVTQGVSMCVCAIAVDEPGKGCACVSAAVHVNACAVLAALRMLAAEGVMYPPPSALSGPIQLLPGWLEDRLRSLRLILVALLL
jgi:hypothetical protein